MPVLFALFRFLVVLILQIVAFFFFYNHPHGRHAVYEAWYAWIIDLLAILSGTAIMAAAIYAYYNPGLFTFTVPTWVFWITFIIGGWQASIHAVKWLIRLRR